MISPTKDIGDHVAGRQVGDPIAPLTASVFCVGVSAMPSRDGEPATKEGPIEPRTFRHHRL
jgi:hypothetical protein